MVSLVVNFLDFVSRLIPKPQHIHSHPLGIPYPQEPHRTLNELFLKHFDEVLVIGDIHGCLDELKALLKNANAEGDNVLKIFVGDLVNKGPKSKEVLDFVGNSNSMLTVRGNHDEKVIREYYSSKKSTHKLKKKNLWVKDMTEDNVKFLIELPYTISIPSLNVIIVHAGLVPGIPLEMQNITDLVNMRNIEMMDYFWDGGPLALDETTQGEAWGSLWGGPQHVYFGHNASRMFQKHSFATGLDTGCVYGNWLTGVFIYGPRKGTFVEAKASKAYSKQKKSHKKKS